MNPYSRLNENDVYTPAPHFSNPLISHPSPACTSPILKTSASPLSLKILVTSSTCSTPTTTAIPIPQLNVLAISAGATPPSAMSQRKTGEKVKEPASIQHPVPLGKTRGTFSVNPPPVMWERPLINPSRTAGRSCLT